MFIHQRESGPLVRSSMALLLVVGGCASGFAQARRQEGGGFTAQEVRQARKDPGKFEIASVSIKRLGPNLHLKAPPGELEAPPPIDGGIDLGRIVNIALKAWDVIKQNAPVVSVNRSYANAVPDGIQRWDQLSGWKPPRGTVYAFKAVNKFGTTVVDVKYQVIRTYGGGLEGPDGTVRGRYLTGVTIEPLMVDTAWGYKLDLSVTVPSVINAGATKEDPVAGMTVDLQWHVSTPLKDSQGTAVYYLQGDGLYQEIGGPFNADFVDRMAPRLERIGALATPTWDKLLSP